MKRKEGGFTIVEVVIAVTVIGVLLIIAMTTFNVLNVIINTTPLPGDMNIQLATRC